MQNLSMKMSTDRWIFGQTAIYNIPQLFKRDFAGGPQNQKMTMPDNMSGQLVSLDKVQNRDRLDEKWSTGPGQRFLFFTPEAPLSMGLQVQKIKMAATQLWVVSDQNRFTPGLRPSVRTK